MFALDSLNSVGHLICKCVNKMTRVGSAKLSYQSVPIVVPYSVFNFLILKVIFKNCSLFKFDFIAAVFVTFFSFHRSDKLKFDK